MPIKPPVTREKVRALAAERADDPTSVVEIPHCGFNADSVHGGYAFLADWGMLICGEMCCLWSVDPGTPADRIALVEDTWQKTRHRNRLLRLSDVNEWHRAAIATLAEGLDSVADLPPDRRPGVRDTAVADEILVFLRRWSDEPTEAAALRTLAANDWLLALPNAYTRAHPCPICGRPALGRPWRCLLSVCDACFSLATCTHGRLVDGRNLDWWGGFEASHADDGTPCDQVTEDGRVTVRGRDCVMGEVRIGGVFVAVRVDETD